MTMDIQGMMQVYSLPNLQAKADKPEKEWFIYQNNGIFAARLVFQC
jgi:hypothetical protein